MGSSSVTKECFQHNDVGILQIIILYKNFLLSHKPEYIAMESIMNKSFETISICKNDLIKILWANILCLKIYWCDMKAPGITVITLAISIFISRTISPNSLPAHIPTTFVNFTNNINIFKPAIFSERKYALPEWKISSTSSYPGTVNVY